MSHFITLSPTAWINVESIVSVVDNGTMLIVQTAGASQCDEFPAHPERFLHGEQRQALLLFLTAHADNWHISEGTADEPPQDAGDPDAMPSDPDYNHDYPF